MADLVSEAISPGTRAWKIGATSALAVALVLGLRAVWSTSVRVETASAQNPTGPARHVASVVATAKDGTKPSESLARVALGKKIFFDPNLSEPAGTSCATCHDPERGFAGNNGSKIGVAQGSRPGHFARRSTPSVLYLKFIRPFHFHWEEDAPLPDAFGGFFWDGRSDSIAELVKQPLLNPDEMGNPDARRILEKLSASAYAVDFRREFPNGFEDPDAALAALGQALEALLKSAEMSPFSSKYDAYIRGQMKFTPLEARGLTLFKDAAKGGCSECHKLNDASSNPERSLFSDYGYDAVAAPRNRALPGNRDAKSFDLGLCERRDPHSHTDEDRLCGSFRTPSLRNVALRPSFMHNGVFSKLRDVVAFYATRDTNSKRWYKSGVTFDDVPAAYREHVNTSQVPYNRLPGQTPLLDDAEIDALVAFLGTLSDAGKPMQSLDRADHDPPQ